MIKTDYPKLETKGDRRDCAKIPNGDRRLVFISGPYKAKTEKEKNSNIWHAMQAAIRLWQKNWFVICPHLNTAHFENFTDLDESIWLEGGLEMLSRCDCVFMLSGWEESEGSVVEYNLAQELELPIYYEDSY